MRLVRLGQQPSRVAEDVRAALASLGRGSTVIGGVALIGARPAGGERAVEAVVVLPKGVLIVIGVDLPDPALRLEAPLGGPWKADGWPLVHGDDVNPATEALDLSAECERRIAELAPGSGPVGTIVAVGPYVETVDQPPADLAGPVRVLHPTPTAMLAATVSLATARSARSLDQARALITALAPDAPAMSDEVLLGEGFVRYTDDPPVPVVPVTVPAPARPSVVPPAVSPSGNAAGAKPVQRGRITSVPPPPPVIPTTRPVPHVAAPAAAASLAGTPTQPPAFPGVPGSSTSATSPGTSPDPAIHLAEAPTESTAAPSPSTSAAPEQAIPRAGTANETGAPPLFPGAWGSSTSAAADTALEQAHEAGAAPQFSGTPGSSVSATSPADGTDSEQAVRRAGAANGAPPLLPGAAASPAATETTGAEPEQASHLADAPTESHSAPTFPGAAGMSASAAGGRVDAEAEQEASPATEPEQGVPLADGPTESTAAPGFPGARVAGPSTSAGGRGAGGSWDSASTEKMTSPKQGGQRPAVRPTVPAPRPVVPPAGTGRPVGTPPVTAGGKSAAAAAGKPVAGGEPPARPGAGANSSRAVSSAPSAVGSVEVPAAGGSVPPREKEQSRTVRWVPVAAIGLLAILLVTAIVVAATGGGGGGEAAPAPSSSARPVPPPAAVSSAPASSAAPSLSFEPRASSSDQRCASHAFGDVQASLQQTSCSAVRRASYTAQVDGRAAAVTMAVVEFPDATQATHFKQIADTPGGGGILDVATETGKWPAPAPQFDSAAYASKLDGNGVRLVQVVWLSGPSTPDDPGLTRAAQGALALAMPA